MGTDFHEETDLDETIVEEQQQVMAVEETSLNEAGEDSPTLNGVASASEAVTSTEPELQLFSDNEMNFTSTAVPEGISRLFTQIYLTEYYSCNRFYTGMQQPWLFANNRALNCGMDNEDRSFMHAELNKLRRFTGTLSVTSPLAMCTMILCSGAKIMEHEAAVLDMTTDTDEDMGRKTVKAGLKAVLSHVITTVWHDNRYWWGHG